MATYDIGPDTVKLLSDPTKTTLGKNGKITELKEVNEELAEIIRKFTDIALLKWLGDNNACGPERGDTRELLCGDAAVNLVTVDLVTKDRGTVNYLIASQPTEIFKRNRRPEDIPRDVQIFQSMSRIELPPQWPRLLTFASYFGKRTKKLRIVLSTELPIAVNAPLKRGSLRPQNKALYSLFLNHPDGLVPSDILCDEKMYYEFLELWEKERPTKDDLGIQKFVNNKAYWKKKRKMATSRIHKMIAALNNSLAEDGDLRYAAFYQVRQLESKKRGEKFFLPLNYLVKKK